MQSNDGNSVGGAGNEQQNQNLASMAESEMMAAATMGRQQNQQQHPQGTMDMASVLAKIQALEREKMEMKSNLEQTNMRLSRLQEGKRAEMEAMMNSTISKWLEQLETKDGTAKESLREGLNKLVQDGNESGVWEVVACASSNWASNVNTIEALTNEINSYKEKERQLHGGLFREEDSRLENSTTSKRKSDDISQRDPSDIWGEFENMIMRSGGNRGADYSQSGPGATGGMINPNTLR